MPAPSLAGRIIDLPELEFEMLSFLVLKPRNLRDVIAFGITLGYPGIDAVVAVQGLVERDLVVRVPGADADGYNRIGTLFFEVEGDKLTYIEEVISVRLANS